MSGLRPPYFTFRPIKLLGALLCASVLFASMPLSADDFDRRAQAGVRLFRALLAADVDVVKKAADDGKLHVIFYYRDRPARAKELAAAMAGGGGEAEQVRGLPVELQISTDPSFAQFAGQKPAGIYIAEPPDEATLKKIIEYGVKNKVIIYSPFEGHVEAGVLGGLFVEAQVRPYVNSATLQLSGITLKPFFLKVAKVFP